MRTGALFYDLKHNPPTWNGFDCHLAGELWRIEQSIDKIVVKILPGPVDGFRADKLPPFGGEERTRWLNNIVVPMGKLLPSCGQEATFAGRSETFGKIEYGRNDYTVGFRWNVKAATANVYPFRAEPSKDFGRNYVTITMRETGWWKGRTSSVELWSEIGRGIRERGFDVVFVRDARLAEQPIEDFALAPEASKRSDIRASIYAGARMNIGISNGPLWFAWFMGVPVMIFDLLHDDEPCASASIFEQAGLKPGQQLPNAKRGQFIHWAKADAAEALAAFDQRILEVM